MQACDNKELWITRFRWDPTEAILIWSAWSTVSTVHICLAKPSAISVWDHRMTRDKENKWCCHYPASCVWSYHVMYRKTSWVLDARIITSPCIGVCCLFAVPLITRNCVQWQKSDWNCDTLEWDLFHSRRCNPLTHIWKKSIGIEDKLRSKDYLWEFPKYSANSYMSVSKMFVQ